MTVAIVLAAGEGSRFAGDGHKLLVAVDGTPVVVRAVAAAVASGLEVGVVWGAVDLRDALAGFEVELVRCDAWPEGIAASLQAGLGWAERRQAPAVAVGLGDQPGVSASAWSAVANCDAPIAVATYAGRRGNPVRFAAELWPRLPRSGDEGGRLLIRERPDLVTEVPCAGDPADIDTVEDLARWS
jgi:CTP:molybdopterin cytidylyltransferase MocA